MPRIVHEDAPGVVAEAVEVLLAGEVLCFPTDTVYGLGVIATNDAAVRKLTLAKGRAPDKPLPLLISDMGDALLYADVSPLGRSLMGRFWPGPLTIVMQKKPQYRSAALAGSDKIGLRVPDHELVRELIRRVREPITGTSANRSGGRSPASAQEAAFALGELVSLVIDGGRLRGGQESTVVDITDGVKIVREGAVSREELQQAVGKEIT